MFFIKKCTQESACHTNFAMNCNLVPNKVRYFKSIYFFQKLELSSKNNKALFHVTSYSGRFGQGREGNQVNMILGPLLAPFYTRFAVTGSGVTVSLEINQLIEDVTQSD